MTIITNVITINVKTNTVITRGAVIMEVKLYHPPQLTLLSLVYSRFRINARPRDHSLSCVTSGRPCPQEVITHREFGIALFILNSVQGAGSAQVWWIICFLRYPWWYTATDYCVRSNLLDVVITCTVAAVLTVYKAGICCKLLFKLLCS